MGWYRGFAPYVPVAKRQADAKRVMDVRRKKGLPVCPVQITGREFATSFWGKAWCTNLEGYSDFANRLPRGASYARNGSIVHLEIENGQINAFVSGSQLYTIKIQIDPLPKKNWKALQKKCAGKVDSLVGLLQGKLSQGVMEVVTDRVNGLFPKPKEIRLKCSCPDYAGICKHIAAVMYGVGNRLDSSPELLFQLRGVDHVELLEQSIPTTAAIKNDGNTTLAADNLGDIFGIDIDVETPPAKKAVVKKAVVKKAVVKKAVVKKAVVKKAVVKKTKTVVSAAPAEAKTVGPSQSAKILQVEQKKRVARRLPKKG
jgi:uncharacterized Zn finger protein